MEPWSAKLRGKSKQGTGDRNFEPEREECAAEQSRLAAIHNESKTLTRICPTQSEVHGEAENTTYMQGRGGQNKFHITRTYMSMPTRNGTELEDGFQETQKLYWIFIMCAYKHNKFMAESNETTNPIAEVQGPKTRWESAWKGLCCHGPCNPKTKIPMRNARAVDAGARPR